jgi:holo-[acyl-carrier protein] synthase
MILGVGVDIAKFDRINKAYRRFGERFVNRVLGEEEQKLFARQSRPTQFLAGRFAGKEAFIKALGTVLQNRPRWCDMEILPDSSGVPRIELASADPCLKDVRYHVSISHEHEYAVAMVVIESD